MENEEQAAPPRPEVDISNLTRHPWFFGPNVKMIRVKGKDGMFPKVINSEVIHIGAMHDKVDPLGWRIKVSGDLWHEYATSDHLGPTIAGLIDRGELSVSGYAA